MTKKINAMIALITMTASVFYINGCTLVGMGIGALGDSLKKNNFAGWEITRIKPGKEITVYGRDGTMLYGIYEGIVKMPETVYAPSYAEFYQTYSASANIPQLDDNITCLLKDGRNATGRFAGFDIRLDSALTQPCIAIKDSIGTNPRTAAINSLDGVKYDNGDSINMAGLADMIGSGIVPYLTAISIQTGFGRRDIPLEKIMMVKTKGSHSGLAAGLVIGAVADLAILIIAASSDPMSGSLLSDNSSSSGSMSCPFIYSFDGKGYIRDSETFGGAIFKAAQRTDYDNLDHLAVVDSTCRLLITNELDEIQYIDELKLLAIDHPADISVIPSFTGELHTINSPVFPTRAVDYKGNNVKELIDNKDTDFWVSNPFGRNPDNVTEVRDGIILDFPRPAQSEFVKLAFNLQNTQWAAQMQGEMLKLQGSGLDKWYETLNNSPEDRLKLRTVMVREGMLLVKIWNGQDWQLADFIWEVGPSVTKDQALMVNLRGIYGDTLKIRLESTAGFWMINSVIADYTPDTPFEVMDLPLRCATDFHGKDLFRQLSQNDGEYYVMPSKEDWAELEFSAPPAKAELARSYILKSAGYYTIEVTPDGQPQIELIARLMEEPGAYGQFALRKLYDNLELALSGIKRAGLE